MAMPENEAIERLQCMRLFMQIEDKKNESKFLEDGYVANKMAIQALEEIQRQKTKIGMFVTLEERMEISKCIAELDEYRAIGTIEEFKALKEKSVAKKPIQQETTEKTHYKCPCCNNIMQTIYRDGVGWGHIADYCEWCGQKIDRY